MDDIKLCAKNEWSIDSLIHLTGIYSEDIRMSFGLKKCGRMIARRRKMIKTDGLELPAGHIADIQTSYKYLGIPQSHGNHDEEARKTATSKYHQRGPEKPAQWEEQDLGHYIRPTHTPYQSSDTLPA